MYKEAQWHRAVLPAIAWHLFIACIALQFVSMCWVRFHSPSCASMRCRSSSHVSRPQKLLALSSSMSQHLGFEARSCYCMTVRVLLPSCASMRRCARPCASIRVHVVQCAPMRLSGTPCLLLFYYYVTKVRRNACIHKARTLINSSFLSLSHL